MLSGIDLTLHPGSSVGVAGPNGSGKTTLVRAMATLIPVESGELGVLGVDSRSGDLSLARRDIGLIGHQPAAIPELTLAENLGHLARLVGIEPGRVPYALEVVGLADAADRRAAACSFGMLRRLEIAHLLLRRPRLLLLDEAASGLDGSASDLIVALIQSVRDRGGGALVVSHDTTHLTALCETVLGLASGRLVEPA